MIEEIRHILKPLAMDDGILMVAVYRVDGTPIVVESKKVRGVLDVIYWLEKQIQGMIYYIYSASLSMAEFRFRDYYVVLYPVSRSMVLGVLAKVDVSAYKLRIELVSVGEMIKEHVEA